MTDRDPRHAAARYSRSCAACGVRTAASRVALQRLHSTALLQHQLHPIITPPLRFLQLLQASTRINLNLPQANGPQQPLPRLTQYSSDSAEERTASAGFVGPFPNPQLKPLGVALDELRRPQNFMLLSNRLCCKFWRGRSVQNRNRQKQEHWHHVRRVSKRRLRSARILARPFGLSTDA